MTDKKHEKTSRRPDGGERPPRRRITAPPKAAPARHDEKPAPDSVAKAFEGDRIAKVMARAGACSRRDAEIWIAEGRVSVNGRALTTPAVNVRDDDRIEVDGKPLAEREPTRLFLFHKPVGLVTSAKDPEGRETVFGYLDQRYPDLPRVVSVGRLDINTEGLLLLTNDGGLARTLELPATGWTRRYRVRAHGEIDQAQLDKLKEGVTVDGIDYAPIDARLDRVQGANAWISMSLREGKNREIKRVLEHLGLDVNRLIRISFGPFQLGEIGEGEVEEVKLKTLREQLGKGLAELAGVDFSSPSRAPTEPEHVLAEEARQRAQKRTRKHVSVLRAPPDDKGEKRPRARIERSATSDRKGRAVAVEKIVPTRRKEEPATTRNARHFRDDAAPPRIRREPRAGEEAAPRSRGRFDGPREERDRGEFRGARPARDEGARRSAPAKRPYGESAERRGPRRDAASGAASGESRPQSRGRFGEQREERDRSDFRGARPPRRDGEARPPRRDGEARPHSPAGKRPYAARDERPRKFEGDDRRRTAKFDAAPGESAPRSRSRPPEGREERDRGARPPRRDGEARPPRREGGEGRPPRRDAEARPHSPAGKRPYAARDERPRKFEGAKKFEGEGRGRTTRSSAASGESAPRSRTSAPREERDRGEFRGARPPREGGEARGRPPAKRPYAAKEGREKFERDDRRPRSSEGADAKPRGPRPAYGANKPHGPRSGGGKPGGGKPSGGKPGGGKAGGGPRKPGAGPRKPREPR